ncbi:uncharacterized protein LOC110443402 [Mizuhopecten yessoensis]|uniref:Isochorismatase-like domain-containing protein n=1 Tax=Mizuhopecten yessoensis TaxID=6573 RepID=A0A210PEY5_MIZYE|nr:uncharacterized protein LOC110443402 [Mizuhopecten yessoensis]OWF35027.1 hypothetical protein KP79_PYT11372 [Mizuhopecten yessoensis]
MCASLTHSKPVGKIAVILIDIQHSFVLGSWSKPVSVQRIKESFENCKKLVESLLPTVPVLLTQCPFTNPKDRAFHSSVKGLFEERNYPVVYKYDTNIMEADGAESWVKSMLEKKVNTIVIGGCTTTSCVRVSSSALCQNFVNDPVQFIVDLSLCGARDSNYVKRCRDCMQSYMQFGETRNCDLCASSTEGLISPVDLAVENMSNAGVLVKEHFDWSPYSV